MRKISVGLDRPPKPCDRLLPNGEVDSSLCPQWRPDVCHRIAWTEAQGLGNVSFCFLGATDVNLSNSDVGMGVGKISIQRQRMFTFGDALCRALGHIFRQTPSTYGRAHGPGPTTRLWSISLRPPRRPPGDRSQRRYAPSAASARADPMSASTLSGSAASARSKNMRACAILSGVAPLLNQAKP